MSGDDHALRMLQHIDVTFRTEIRQADQKASIVIAFIAGLFSLNRDSVNLAVDTMTIGVNLYASLVLVLFVTLLLSMTCAFCTIAPRVYGTTTSIMFWRNWRSVDEIATNGRNIQDAGFGRSELTRDIGVLARVIGTKLFWLRWALFSLYAALLLFALLVSATVFSPML